MPFQLDSNGILNCELSNPQFQNNLKYLLSLSTEYLNKITNLDSINYNIVSTFGEKCFQLSQTPTKYSDLTNEEDYPKVFIGTYSTHFIQIMILIQLIWQRKENLDTYTGFSEGRSYQGGVSPTDKEYFFSYLKDLKNKLLIINHLVEKQ